MRWWCWTVGGWMSELHGLPSSAPAPPPSQRLPGRNVLPMEPVRNFCWTLTLSGSSSPAVPLFLPIVWVPRSPHLLVALPQVPKMHVVTVTLACMSMALSLKSRACKEGAEQPDGAKPGHHNGAFCSLGPCSAFQACPALPAAPLLQKVVQGG